MSKPIARMIPSDSQKMTSRLSSAVVYCYRRGGKAMAVGYVGKAEKPSFHYSFKSDESRSAHVREFFARAAVDVAAKAARSAEKKAALAKPHTLKPGDVLVSSWGYDQTNIDYFQVVRLIGARSIAIRKICAECVDVEGAYMQGKSVPVVGAFVEDSEEMIKRVDQFNSVRIASYASAHPAKKILAANGKFVGYEPQSWTAYA